MEHQHYWPGQSPGTEPERVENPPSLPQIQSGINQILSPSLSATTNQGCVEAEGMSDVRHRSLYRRQNWAQPIESLVQRLKKHSLKPRDRQTTDQPDSTNLAPARRHDKIFRVLRRHGNVPMDIDQSQDVDMTTAVPANEVAVTDQFPDQTSHHKPSPSIHQVNVPNASPGNSSPARTIIPSMLITPTSTEASRRPALIEVDPKQNLESDDFDLDEGYGDGFEDFAWANDGRSLIRSLANHARKSGALRYRTSAEAALECSQIVHRAPRMRRRRHKKNQTRLRASSTVSTCGFDNQNIINPNTPVS